MIVEKASSPIASRWYLIARDGDAAVRVKSGMQLGEDSTGELSLEPTNPLVEFELTDDGSLALRVTSDTHELELPNHQRTQRVDLDPQTPAQVRFLSNTLSINTDFTTTRGSHDTLDIQVVTTEQDDPIAFGTIASLYGRNETQGGGDPGILVPEALPRPSPAKTIINFLSHTLARWRFGTALTARNASVAAVVSVIAVGCIYLISQQQAEKPQPETTSVSNAPKAPGNDALQPQPTNAAPGESQLSADTVARNNPLLVSVSALLEAEQLPSETTIDFALQSLKALLVAYPNDLAVRQGLENLTQRLTSEAMLNFDRGDVDLAARLITQAASSGVALEYVSSAVSYASAASQDSAARSADTDVDNLAPDTAKAEIQTASADTTLVDPPKPATDIELESEDQAANASLNSGDRQQTAGIASEIRAANSEPPEELTVNAPTIRLSDATGNAQPTRDNPQPSEGDDAIQRDLRSAAEALNNGRLVAPAEPNAFALYQRLLEIYPESKVAKRGLQAVRERLLDRARGLLAANDMSAAFTAIDDASNVGADENIVNELRAAAIDRQRLVDARTGKFSSLYPFAQLTVIRQDPPTYPRIAPEGAEGSVDLELTVTKSGDVRDVEVRGEAPRFFARPARQAVKKWKFEPVTAEGKPVPVRTSVRLTFRS